MKNKTEQQEAIKALRKTLKAGDTVYTVLRHVSSSGMSRRIDLYTMKKNKPVGLTYYTAKALGYTRHPEKDGLTVGGCGMDMGFSVVYNLGRVLFPKGFKVKGTGRNSDTSGHDNDGGYALEQRWL